MSGTKDSNESKAAAPKAFISYSWTSESHREMVRNWADRLLADGVEVVLDQYDLKEGHDKNAFMEKMVTDPTVTHVLLICDRRYAEKADARQAGVGTESQIISQEVYSKVQQSKFVPILCELSDTGEPYLPTFIKSRIGVNFSSPELVNDNWEQLVRLLFGKPAYQKPLVGKPPSYVSEDTQSPSNPAIAKFASLKQAVMQDKKGVPLYREDFLAACFQYADALRVRQPPNLEKLGEQILEDCGKLLPIRNLIVDWILLEGVDPGSNQFEDAFSTVLEKLIELRSRPAEINPYNDVWFEAHELFVYETFLYVVAALLKVGAFGMLHDVFHSQYLRAEIDRRSSSTNFTTFEVFWAHSDMLNPLLAPKGQKLLSPAAALIKRQATRADLPFATVMEAELLTTLASLLAGRARWLPRTLYYSGYGMIFPFFLKAAQHKHFKKLAIVTGLSTGDELRSRTAAEFEKVKGLQVWQTFGFHSNASLFEAMNREHWDTIQ
jgi:hypothetical protein